MQTEQQIRVILSPEDFRSMDLSVPHWDAISRDPANRGFVRHGVRRAESQIPREMKPGYAVHAEPYVSQGNSSLLMFGTRNSAQNLFLPAFHANRAPRLLARIDEPWRTETYAAFLFMRDGTCRTERVRFAGDGPASIQVEVLYGTHWRETEDVLWLITGQPVLWDGGVPGVRLCGCTYDLRHIWHLDWQSPSGAGRDTEIHHELMTIMMENLDQGPEARAKLLLDAAEGAGLQIEDQYYHSSLGLAESGEAVLLARHGSLEKIGRAQARAGASRAVLLDNGGSAAYAVRNSEDGRLTVFGNNSYFRPNAHALVVVALNQDYEERPVREPLPEDLSRILDHTSGPILVTHVRADLQKAGKTTKVFFDDPQGVIEEDVPGDIHHEVTREWLAVAICNHSVIYGTRCVKVVGPAWAVADIQRRFERRFNPERPGSVMGNDSLADYLSAYNGGTRYEISAAGPGSNFEPVAGTASQGLLSGEPPAGLHVIGLDVGVTALKATLELHDGREYCHRIPTKPPSGDYTSDVLRDRLLQVIAELCEKAGGPSGSAAEGCRTLSVRGIGLSWPGACRDGRIAGHSSILLDLVDIFDRGKLNQKSYERTAGIAEVLAEQCGVPVWLQNDGNVEAFQAAHRRGFKHCLVVKLGGGLAGGYVDGWGRCDLLTELGRFVLDLDPRATAHPFTRITGLAREMVTSSALARLMLEYGVDHYVDEAVRPKSAGLIGSRILDDPAHPQYAMMQYLLGLIGDRLGESLFALSGYLDIGADGGSEGHIIIGGGLGATATTFGSQLVKRARLRLSRLSPQLAKSLVVEEGAETDEFEGARAASYYGRVMLASAEAGSR